MFREEEEGRGKKGDMMSSGKNRVKDAVMDGQAAIREAVREFEALVNEVDEDGKADMADDVYWAKIIEAARLGLTLESEHDKDAQFGKILNAARIGAGLDLGKLAGERIRKRLMGHVEKLERVLGKLREVQGR